MSSIISKPASAEYTDGWDRIFKKRDIDAAIKAYWDATTPEAERAAYARMMELGISDGYVASEADKEFGTQSDVTDGPTEPPV